MRLYIPKKMVRPTEATDEEYVMDMVDWMDLAEIMEVFPDFAHLKAAVAKSKTVNGKIDCRYPGMVMKSLPVGSQRDWYNAVLNCFGDYCERDLKRAKFPESMDKKLLLSRLAGELSCSPPIAKTRLDALVNGRWLKLDYGMIMFPTDNLRSE